jgi:hypothetical protein
MAKGPTQSIDYNFPQSNDKRSFQRLWFQKHGWLEYSLDNNKAYCFYCYLFKHDSMDDKFFMMHLQKLDSHSGRMLIWHFQNMLMGLIAYTIMHQQYSMILLTKGQV